MKKLTLLAAMAAAVLSANAQYSTTDAGIQPVLDKGAEAAEFYAFLLDAGTVQQLKNAGKTVHEYFTDDVTRFLYVWEGTFVAGDGTAPGVDFQADGYTSLTVANGTTWSGAGFNQNKGTEGMDFSGLSDATRLHLAYMAPSNPIKSVGMTLLDKDKIDKDDAGNTPAPFSIGGAFVDNGQTWPSVAPAPTDEWQAVDMSFGDLKKLFPAFQLQAVKGWTGNYMAFLGGAVAGTNICFDAFYFYQPKGESGISSIEMGNSDIVITGKTVNASGAKRIEIFDLAGKSVKAANASVLGLNDIPAGLYIVKADNAVAKVVVK